MRKETSAANTALRSMVNLYVRKIWVSIEVYSVCQVGSCYNNLMSTDRRKLASIKWGSRNWILFDRTSPSLETCCSHKAVRRKDKISAQPHTTLCIQSLDRENNDKNNTLPLGKQICFTIVWGWAEIFPKEVLFSN